MESHRSWEDRGLTLIAPAESLPSSWYRDHGPTDPNFTDRFRACFAIKVPTVPCLMNATLGGKMPGFAGDCTRLLSVLTPNSV